MTSIEMSPPPMATALPALAGLLAPAVAGPLLAATMRRRAAQRLLPHTSPAAATASSARVWLPGALASVVVAVLSLALSVLERIRLARLAEPLPAAATAALGLAAAAWFSVAVAIAANARSLNSVPESGAPPDTPSVTPALIAMLAVHAAANAARISLGHADPLRIDAWISLDGASATTAIVAILLEFGRWNFVESARADALEAFLFNRTDGNGNKIPVPSFEENASLVGKLLFTWINPLIRKSSRTPLEHEDVWDLCEVDRVKNLTRRFNESKKRFKTTAMRILHFEWKALLMATLLSIVSSILALGPPFFLNRIINFIEHGRNQPIAIGLAYAAGMFAASMLRSWADIHNYYFGRRTGFHSRAVLVSEIYRKALRRRAATANTEPAKDAAAGASDSASKDAKASIGKIVTLMSVDAKRLREDLADVPQVFALPFQIAASIYGLFSILGWSSLAGIAIMIISVPLGVAVSRFQFRMTERYLRMMDRRVGAVNEMLQGIRVLKYFGWEPEFARKIGRARKGELDSLIGVFFGKALAGLVWESVPLLVSFVTFLTYTKIAGHELDVTTAFTSLSLFMTLRSPLAQLPQCLSYATQILVSLRRIEAFLSQPELDKFQPDKQHLFESDWSEIATRPGFRNATFTWDSDAKADAETAGAQAAATERDPLLAADSQPPSLHHHFVLSDVHVTFPVGCLTAVVGVTGAGKSSIAQALLGEMTMLRGRTVFPSMFSRFAPDFGSRDTRVAYVAQTAWLQNASVRDNILFGAPLDEQRYSQVIEACALVRDLATFPAGDMTEIGEKGINMSGGQKQRISLARACYSAAQFVILDDPLSAVDAPTALHLFDKCICGILLGRTVVLVTHATGLVLPSADHVVYVKSGRIAAHGSGVDMQRQLEELDDSFGKHLLRALRGDKVDGSASDSAGSSAQQAADPPTDGDDAADASKHDASGKLIAKETKQSGSVKAAVYLSYLRAVGGGGFIFLYLLFSALGRVAQVADDWWLKIWADSYMTSMFEPAANATMSFATRLSASMPSFVVQSGESSVASVASLSIASANSTIGGSPGHSVDFYIGVYGALGLGVILSSQLVNLLYALGSYRASKEMHAALLVRILNAPMRFFDTTPIGRILNRFSKDIEGIDVDVGDASRHFLRSTFQVICTAVVVASFSPAFALFFVPVSYVFLRISTMYVNASRELGRLESVAQSPIYSQFSETLQGAACIRAYGQEQRFIDENLVLIDRSQQATVTRSMANRWFDVRCDATAAGMVLVASISLIFARNTIDAGLAGLCLAYALDLVTSISSIARRQSRLEVSMNAVERIDEYLNIDQEAAAIVPSYRPADNWPTHGAIDIQDLSVRYAPDQPRVLDGFSFSVGACEKVGIVGRTGAGKSTLSLALFRIVPHDGGRIVIDGMDIGRMGLWDLRSRLTIIPQDPVLFAGTVRSNLDPFDKHDDAALWASLQRVHFLESLQTKTAVGTAASGSDGDTLASGVGGSGSSGTADAAGGFSLDSAVSENGANFSQGQRQLLCLARALLQAPRIIVLDEATASVDHATDAKIQSTIRTEFSGATVLTIAHRLSTVMDYDKILVLDHGRVVQFGRPRDLMQDANGMLHQMCAESGEMGQLVSIAARQGTA